MQCVRTYLYYNNIVQGVLNYISVYYTLLRTGDADRQRYTELYYNNNIILGIIIVVVVDVVVGVYIYEVLKLSRK